MQFNFYMEGLVAAISQDFLISLYQLTATAHAGGMVCPPLIALNRWTIGQMTAPASTETKAGMPTGGTAAIGEADFSTAVLAAVKSSPDGVSAADLRPILAHYNQAPNIIGTALGRLARAGQLEKRGDLWFWKSDTKVDTSLSQRRNQKSEAAPRARRQRQPAAGGEQQQAVA